MTAVFFAIGPSTFYHSIFYTESLFLFIYLSSLLLILDMIMIEKKKIGELSWKRLIFISLYFSTAGFIRSVGFLNAAHLCYPILLEIIFHVKEKHSFTLIASKFFKILLLSIIFLAPFSLIQYNVYNQHCRTPTTNIPSFCNSTLPNSYSYIQKEYWNVEPFSFIKNNKIEELIFVKLSFPVWVAFVINYLGMDFYKILNIFTGFIPEYLKRGDYLNVEFFIYPNSVILLILGIFSFSSANLCSVDRFMSAVPFYYIIFTDFYFRISKTKYLRLVFLYLLATHYSFNIFSYTVLWQPS